MLLISDLGSTLGGTEIDLTHLYKNVRYLPYLLQLLAPKITTIF